MLYCPNPICQTPNPETHRFCQKCRTPLMHRYLWGVGTLAAAYRAGDIVGDRFLCKGSRIFLDSKPGLPPINYGEVPEPLLPYLRLSAGQLHLPQIYDWLQFESDTRQYSADNTLLLLEQAPLYRPDSLPEDSLPEEGLAKLSSTVALPFSLPDQEVQIFPALAQMWQLATAFRQLHWLWQIAQLWQPLSQEQCAATLLDADLLRVEGGLLRILELEADRATASLAALGQSWLTWATVAQPEIQGFLQHLCQQMIDGNLHNAEQVIEQLDWAIAQVAQGQTYRVSIATRTDQGPTRQRNEDACYPTSGTEQTDVALPLVIVCDGIGGHQGGDVASHLAIEAVAQRILSLPLATLDSASLSLELEKAACLANDGISQRNDSEQRYDRQRMGTTIVMALMRHHELYIVHVGDSRAYWITQWGCHQITVDDDIASREVRLGYSTYRQALQQPSSGALVQALGMVGSSMLYPTVQRFLLDEDSVFLLCSDGLCDNDRVEEVWDTEVLPILGGKTNLLSVTRSLVDIGNTRNGYDNVTVGLLSCQVLQKQSIAPLPAQIVDRSAFQPASGATLSGTPTQIAAPVLFPTPQTQPAAEPTIAKTRIIPRKSSRPRLLPWLVGIAILAGLSVALYPLLLEALGNRQVSLNPESSPSPAPAPVAPAALTTNALLRIRSAAEAAPATPSIASAPNQELVLQSRPATPVPPPLPAPGAVLPASPSPAVSAAIESASISLGSIPAGTILEVLSKQGETPQNQWVRLRVCSVPIVQPPPAASAPSPTDLPSPAGETGSATETPANPGTITSGATATTDIAPVQPGQEGWLREAELLPIAALDVPLDRASCPLPSPSPLAPSFPAPSSPAPSPSTP